MIFGNCIALLDFAENYQFVVQHQGQSFHWNQSQCFIHPVALYYKNHKNDLIQIFMCSISDDLHHSTSFVYKIFQQITKFVQHELHEYIQKLSTFHTAVQLNIKVIKACLTSVTTKLILEWIALVFFSLLAMVNLLAMERRKRRTGH